MSGETSHPAVAAVRHAINDHDFSRLTDDDTARVAAAVLRWAAGRTRDASLDTVTCGCGCGCGNQLDRDADELTREQRAVIAAEGT